MRQLAAPLLACLLLQASSLAEEIKIGCTLGMLLNDPTVYEDLKVLLGGAQRPRRYGEQQRSP